MDAVRADHIGYHGYSENTTPFLDSLAGESLTAHKCYSQGNATEQEMCTMLSGMYPIQHGVVGQDHPKDLPSDMDTFMGTLRKAGYTTMSVSFTSKALKRGSTKFNRIEDAQRVVDKAKDFADNAKGKYAMFLHFMDAHVPYTATPENFELFYDGDPKSKDYSKRPSELMGPTPRPEEMKSEIEAEVDPEYFSAKYDAAIRRLDGMVKQLYEDVSDDDTLFIVTADHGESLTEHGIYFDHRGLYEPSIHIPFLLNHNTITPDIVDGYVEHVDYFPTICDVLDIDCPDVAGSSILGKWYKDSALFFENTWNSAMGMRFDDYKLIKYCGTKLHNTQDIELFDMESDPEELRNVANRHSDIREDILAVIESECNTLLDGKTNPIENEETTLPDNHPSDEVKERLKDLGYI